MAILTPSDIRRILRNDRNSMPVDDFRIIDSWAEYKNGKSEKERPLDFLCYEIEVVNPETGETQHLYKALKFLRIKRLPYDAKQSTSLMDMHEQVLSAVYENKFNFVTVVANIIHPEPLGLLYLYGVQGVAHDLEEAKEKAHKDYVGLRATLTGTYRVLHTQNITAQETEWLREKMYSMDYLTMTRGIPKAAKTGENAGNKGIGNKNLNPDSQGTLEEFIAGMVDYEYVIQVLTTPVFQKTLEAWQTQTQLDMTMWNGQLQGTKSISANLSIPMMYMANTGQSQGWSHGYTDAQSVSYSSGESFTQSYGESIGQSLSQTFGQTFGQSQGVSVSNSVSTGTSVSVGNSVGQSLGISQTIGNSFGTAHSVGTSESLSESTSQSLGVSQNYGTSVSKGQSIGQSVGETIGQSVSQGQSVSRGTNVGTSENVGTSTGHSTSLSNSTSLGWNTSQSTGTSLGGSQTVSTSQSNGVTHTTGESLSGSNTVSLGVSQNTSDTDSLSVGGGTSDSANTQNSVGGSVGANVAGVISGSVNTADSKGTAIGTTDNWTQGESHATGDALTTSVGGTVSHGDTLSDGTTTSSTNGNSAGQSWSANSSQSAGQSGNVGTSEGISITNSVSQSAGVSQGLNNSESFNVGSSQSLSNSLSNSLTNSLTQGFSESAGMSQSVGSTSGMSIGSSISDSVNQSSSTSNGQSATNSATASNSQSYSVTQGQSVGQTSTTSVSQSSSTGTSQSATQSSTVSNGQSVSKGTSSSTGQSIGTSGTVTTGSSGSMGLGPSIGYNKSYQWLDQQVKDILELLEFQNERIKNALRGNGAFYTYVYIACPSMDALSAAQTLAKSTWQNENAMIQPLQVMYLDESEQKHLLYHFSAFSTDITRTTNFGASEYKYSTVLLPEELIAYTHLPRISEGGIYAEVQDVPHFAVPSMMKGEIFMGSILSAERYSPEHGYETPYDYRISEGELMHGFFTGASRSGKTVAAMRFVAELSQVRRSKTGKRLRIVCMDPKQDWRGLARFVEPERFRFYSLGNPKFHPIKFNPCKIPRGVIPQIWVDVMIEIYCRAYGLLERGKQLMAETFFSLYEEAGVFDAYGKPGWEDIVPELSANVTFAAAYQRMEMYKRQMDDGTSSKGRSGNDTKDAYSRLLERLSAFSRPYSIERQLFGEADGLGVDELIGEDDITVFESKGLESTFRSFIFGVITAGFYRYAIAQEGGFMAPDQYETVLIIEEANEVLTGSDVAGSSDANMGLSGQSEFEQILDQSAGYGLYIFAITQKIADMPKSVIANSGLRFIGKIQTEDDVNVAMKAIGKDPRYDDRNIAKYMPHAPTGWFVCQSSRTSNFLDIEPVLVKISMLNITHPSNSEIDEILTERDARRALRESQDAESEVYQGTRVRV